MRSDAPAIFSALVFLIAATGEAIELGILDDFTDVAVCVNEGWSEGAGSPNPPVGTPGCGEFFNPCCLQNDSSGGFGPGSRQATFNDAQWAGDYLAAGVNKVQFLATNASASEPLFVRVAVSNGTTCYASSGAAELAPNNPGPSGLQTLSFLLDESAMVEVEGNLCGSGESLSTVLSAVAQLRILSSAEPAWEGDSVVATLQLEAIQSRSDQDLDSVNDDVDNCTEAPNADQRDTDDDGFGNACDADLDNDCAVNFEDLGIMKSVFFISDADADADLDGDGYVNFVDLGIMKAGFMTEPGPGLGVCGECTPPDSALPPDADFRAEMFMRGGLVADWGAVPGINNFVNLGDGVYKTRFAVNAGSFDFKFANQGWSLEYGNEGAEEVDAGGPPVTLAQTPAGAANSGVNIPAAGCYSFDVTINDANVPPLTIDLSVTVEQ